MGCAFLSFGPGAKRSRDSRGIKTNHDEPADLHLDVGQSRRSSRGRVGSNGTLFALALNDDASHSERPIRVISVSRTLRDVVLGERAPRQSFGLLPRL